VKRKLSILLLGRSCSQGSPANLWTACLVFGLLGSAELPAQQTGPQSAPPKRFLAEGKQLSISKIDSQSLNHRLYLIVHLQQRCSPDTRLAPAVSKQRALPDNTQVSFRDEQNRSYQGLLKLKPAQVLPAKQLDYELHLPCQQPAQKLIITAVIPYRSSRQCKTFPAQNLQPAEEPSQLKLAGHSYAVEFLQYEANSVTLNLVTDKAELSHEFSFSDEKNNSLLPQSCEISDKNDTRKLQYSYKFGSLPSKFSVTASSWSNFTPQTLRCEIELSLQGVTLKEL